MPSLPSSTDFTGSAVTEAGFKTAITNQREFLAGLLGSSGNQIDALVAMGVLGADSVSKTSGYTVVAADRGKVILCNGTFTLSLTAAATLADGFTFAVVNTGTGTITIDPNSTEQIDGVSTKTVGAGSSLIITCTGTAFYSLGGGSGAIGSSADIFTSSGTWTVPSGVSRAMFIVIGGGGGGGGTSGSLSSSGGNGGLGGLAVASCSQISGSITITVGLGGAGKTNNASGDNGGTSSASGSGVSVTATGGAGGAGTSSNNTSAANGDDGDGSVSTGTALRTGTINTQSAVILLGGTTRVPRNTQTSAIIWSSSSTYSAGAGGSGDSTNLGTGSGGVSGAVLIIY